MDIEVKFDQDVVDLAPSADAAVMWWFDLTTNCATWMPGMAGLLGVPDDAAVEIRSRLMTVVEPLVVAARAAAVWQDFSLEQPYVLPDGTTRWLQLRACVSGDAAAKSLTGVATDVTRRHADQQALEDLADRYRLLVELSPDAIVVHEAGVLTYTNPAGVRFLAARSADEVIGRPITDFVHPASVPDMLRRLSALSTPGAATDPSDATILRFGGGTIDVEVVSVRTTWEGRPAYQVILRDVTAQKAAEATLHYQAALVAHVSDAIIATTEDGLVTTWNPAAESVYGVPAAEAVGRPVGSLVGARLDPAAVVREGGMTRAVHRHSDGTTLVIRVSAAEMDDGYVLVCADETARRRAEQHFTTVVASLEEGVLVVGPSGLVESANPAAERVLGMRAERIIGSPTTACPLYDEQGARLPESEYPCVQTRRTGLPHNGRVVRVRRADGQDIWLSVSCRPLNQVNTYPASVVISFTDITERKSIAARLEHDATHDGLTGLANRTLVIRHLASRTGTLAVLFVDLDKFKVINDSLGHAVGDKVLRVIGERLHRSVRSGDLVGRLGGDEFVVVARDIAGADVRRLAEHLRNAVAAPVSVDGRQLHIDASIGIVITGPGDPRTGEDLLRDSDVAMYQAKSQGRGRYVFFDVDLREKMQRRLQLEGDLRAAASNEQLSVVYQPIADLRSGRVASVEALLRWNHPVHGPISPAEFIPLAEESDLINLVGDHVLRTTTGEAGVVRSRIGTDCDLAVNLSPRQLEDPRLVAAVQDVLRTTGIVPSTLCLEITENALMRDPAVAGRTLRSLRELGVRLAIDDFGTGYSSLAQLRRLPIDQLKIDRSFVSALGENRDAEAIVGSIVMMAHAVNLTVVAEGVETEEQLDVLRRLNCDKVQGFHLGRPTSPDLLPDRLPESQPSTAGR
ncbi:sensor domain-containing protein [Lentzea terrae]|uniref:sensor domain-containing protein n=1 Tax=Lentzea terrae TaxID=2200761 RepID=UPI000DD46233|nr:EAL domain-containing protein [Lentzea terrae]